MLPRGRLFEEHEIPTEGSDVLHAKMMRPKSPVVPKRLVVIPPLIGAGASQPLIIFRNLTRRGTILLSFEYRGHPHSTGLFTLDGTVIDTQYALIWAADYARAHGLPLHGFATCYGLVSLLAQFRGPGAQDLLWSLSAVSGLFRMDQTIRFGDFAPLFSRRLGVELDEAALIEGIAENVFDWNGDAFRQALLEYLGGLFPTLRVGRDFFEELQYHRVEIPQTLLQLAQARYLEGMSVPPSIPCNFFFGRHDDVLGLNVPEGRDDYRRRASAMIPHAVLHECEIDHFGIGTDHDPVIEKLADLFEEAEVRAVPLTLKEGVRSLGNVHP
ncbi:MAG: hypothetical protein JW809_02310 [Pirellulales bacterium]|nr:hypothetical protein [Pirellulales bacterium]